MPFGVAPRQPIGGSLSGGITCRQKRQVALISEIEKLFALIEVMLGELLRGRAHSAGGIRFGQTVQSPPRQKGSHGQFDLRSCWSLFVPSC